MILVLHQYWNSSDTVSKNGIFLFDRVKEGKKQKTPLLSSILRESIKSCLEISFLEMGSTVKQNELAKQNVLRKADSEQETI